MELHMYLVVFQLGCFIQYIFVYFLTEVDLFNYKEASVWHALGGFVLS